MTLLLQSAGMGMCGLSFRGVKDTVASELLANIMVHKNRKTKKRRSCYSCICASKSSLQAHEKHAMDGGRWFLCCKMTSEKSFFSDRYNVLDFVLLLAAIVKCIEYWSLFSVISFSETQIHDVISSNASTTAIPEQTTILRSSLIIKTLVGWLSSITVLRAARPIRALTAFPQVRLDRKPMNPCMVT